MLYDFNQNIDAHYIPPEAIRKKIASHTDTHIRFPGDYPALMLRLSRCQMMDGKLAEFNV